MDRCFNARHRSSNPVSARKTLTTAPPKFVQCLITARAKLVKQWWSSVQDFCVGLADPSVHELASSGFVTGVGFGLTTSINSLSTPAGLTIPATGFSFGVGSASTTTTTSLAAPSISFGTAPSTRSPTPAAGLTFCSTASGTPSTGLTFGSTTQSSTPSTGLTFGLTAQSSTPATGLTFGFTTQSSTPATGLTFGSTALDTPAAGLTFGSTTQSITPAAGFSFGTAVSSAVTTLASLSQPGFSFGATASTSAPVSAGNQTGFSFGVGQSGTTALSSAAFQIGSQQTTTTAAPTFSFGSSAPPATTAATAGFSFGAQTSGTAPPAYGSIATTNPSQTPFGAPTATQTPFGAQTSTTSAPGFNFGASQTTTGSASPFSFAAGPTASTAGSSVFGTQPASTASTPFAFGQGTGPTTTASAQTFNFGGSTQSGLGFGSSSNTAAFGLTTNQPPAFGSSTNQPPAFGAAVNPAPAFGTGSASQTPAFNFGATANPTPAFGATSNPTPAFGATNPTPAFGATSNQTPAFGATNPTPAFGATPNQVPAFGSTNPAPAFGGFGATTTQKSNTPVFGASTNNTGSVFGSTNAPGFSKSQSMPVFATTATGGGPFGNTAPNVNPFGTGQTTPAKQTGNAFGQTNLDSTPKSQTGAMFQFGQSNNNSSAAKGFDFGSSAGSSSQNNAGAGFNFSKFSFVGVGTYQGDHDGRYTWVDHRDFNYLTFNSTPAGTTMGLNDRKWGHIGVTMMAGTLGWIIETSTISPSTPPLLEVGTYRGDHDGRYTWVDHRDFNYLTFNSTPAGTTMGLNDRKWGHIGVTMMAGTLGWIIETSTISPSTPPLLGVGTYRGDHDGRYTSVDHRDFNYLTFNSTSAGTTMGLNDRKWGHIGVTMMAGTLGWIIETSTISPSTPPLLGVGTYQGDHDGRYTWVDHRDFNYLTFNSTPAGTTMGLNDREWGHIRVTMMAGTLGWIIETSTISPSTPPLLGVGTYQGDHDGRYTWVDHRDFNYLTFNSTPAGTTMGLNDREWGHIRVTMMAGTLGWIIETSTISPSTPPLLGVGTYQGDHDGRYTLVDHRDFNYLTFNSTPAGTTMGLNDREWGHIGVTMMAGTLGWIIETSTISPSTPPLLGVGTYRGDHDGQYTSVNYRGYDYLTFNSTSAGTTMGLNDREWGHIGVIMMAVHPNH
ncbi:NU98B-like protein [Mya arenaria]|uniref:NU98B-like protein n=1 Tax=Mya arenaria TaxID=6604 RepID=A0ABY7F3C6_MYAAR|nr:NU98B-like protein [Mya arenaria]